MIASGVAIVELDKVSIADQIQIFQKAEIIIATHGAGLANILFCRSGTRVIELYPSCEFRPIFWVLASKLDLHYGIMSCPSNQFNDPMVVDVGRLARLIDLMSG